MCLPLSTDAELGAEGCRERLTVSSTQVLSSGFQISTKVEPKNLTTPRELPQGLFRSL